MRLPVSTPASGGGAGETVTVMLVDDHELVRQGIAAILEGRPRYRIVAQASDGAEAVRGYRQHRPDITLMDLRMPVMGGVDAIREIRARDPDARIVVLTTYDGDEDVFLAVQAGARGYLLKGMRSADLFDTIETVLAGGRKIPAELAERALRRAAEPDLTTREREVLGLLAEGKTNKEIAGALSLSENTVKGHVQHLFTKLGVTTRTEAMKVGAQRGLVKLG